MSDAHWLPAVRIGLGFMRQSTDEVRDATRAEAVVHTALDEGITLFDTAHSYGHGEHEYGHNERWLGAFLRSHPLGAQARVITKGGMRRLGPRYLPDGRASTLRAQCEASLEALGRPIDLYLLHAVDPKTPLATSVRALMHLRDEGLVRRIGLSNVTRTQLDEALALTPLSGVQLAVSLLDDTALRGGVVQRALELGMPVLCHSPLGGPKKVAQLASQAWLVERARAAGCTAHEWALASLLSLHEKVVVLPGARRVETVRSAKRAAAFDVLNSVQSATPPNTPASTCEDPPTLDTTPVACGEAGVRTFADSAVSTRDSRSDASEVPASPASNDATRVSRGDASEAPTASFADSPSNDATRVSRGDTSEAPAASFTDSPSNDAKRVSRGDAFASESTHTSRDIPAHLPRTSASYGDLPTRRGNATRVSDVPRAPTTPTCDVEREVRLLMGLQGAGKSSAVETLVGEGWARLNRDTEGGSLEQLHRKLETMLRAGATRVVLDNTYVTRSQRGSAIHVAQRLGVPVHGVWHDIEPLQAQVNIVNRMLDVHGRLLTPHELKRGKTPDALSPRAHFATVRSVEPLGDDEGFASIRRVSFVRRPWPQGQPALFLGLELLNGDGSWAPQALSAISAHPKHLKVVVGWREGGVLPPPQVECAVCPHAGGPPECWCRPPLPGLVLERARSLRLSLSDSCFVTTSTVLRSLANAVGLALK